MSSSSVPRGPERPGQWAAIDCSLFENEAMSALSPSEVLLYVAGILYASRQLTDGRIPAGRQLARLCADAGVDRRSVKALEREGLWIPHEQGGWTIKGYLKWQPSRAWWEYQRDRNRAKARAWRERTVTGHEPVSGPGYSPPRDVEVDLELSTRRSRSALRGNATQLEDEHEPTIDEGSSSALDELLAPASSSPSSSADVVRLPVQDVRVPVSKTVPVTASPSSSSSASSAPTGDELAPIGGEAAAILERLRRAAEGAA